MRFLRPVSAWLTYMHMCTYTSVFSAPSTQQALSKYWENGLSSEKEVLRLIPLLPWVKAMFFPTPSEPGYLADIAINAGKVK